MDARGVLGVVVASPTVFKRYVALELARMREAARLHRADAAGHLQCSEAHIRHLETMYRLPKAAEVRTLLAYYGVGERAETFLKVIDAARKGRDWWTGFPGIPKWFDLLLSMETAATAIHSYDNILVPGLFQTPAYAEAVIRGGEPNLSDDNIKSQVNLRMQRQDILTRQPDPPVVWSLLDEAVLHRHADDPAVLPEQLTHLIQLSKLPNVHIQVVLSSANGLHAGTDGTFTVLTFGPELVGDPGVAYTQSRIKGIYYEDAADIARYRDTWGHIQLQALTPEDSRVLLARRAEEATP
jgi:hypothetical protein